MSNKAKIDNNGTNKVIQTFSIPYNEDKFKNGREINIKEKTNSSKEIFNEKRETSRDLILQDKNNEKKYLKKVNYIRHNISSIITYKISKLIIISLISTFVYNQELNSNGNENPNITLKVVGTGMKNIFVNVIEYFPNSKLPNKVYINGVFQDESSKYYNFEQTINNVELIWDHPIDNYTSMFNGCSDITEINFINFDVSKITNMNSMFNGCSKLSSITFSNFDTSNVESMKSMFYGCSKLTSVNLSSFNTSKVTTMTYMFYECKSLEYVNLKNFIQKDSSLEYNNMFKNVPENVIVCLNISNNRIFAAFKTKKCYSIYCSDDWQTEQKKIVNITDMCYDNDMNPISYNYQYKGKYYETCVNQNVTNNKPVKYCKCNTDKCNLCPIELLNNNLYEIENDNYTNMENYVKCYKDPI